MGRMALLRLLVLTVFLTGKNPFGSAELSTISFAFAFAIFAAVYSVGHIEPPNGTSVIDVSNPADSRVIARLGVPSHTHSHKVRARNGIGSHRHS